jgi:hypothetical protein
LAIPRRSGWKKWLLQETIIYDVALAIIALAASIIGAWKFFLDDKPEIGWPLAVAAAFAFVFGVLKQVVLWRQKAHKDSPHDLAGCLHALHAVLLVGTKLDTADPKLRITIHVPIKDCAEFEQVLDYVGDGRRKKTGGRKFPIISGIIGMAFRDKKMLVMTRKNENPTLYIDELMKDWSYSEEEARKRDPETMAWAALPLRKSDQDPVEGVIYLDSVDRDFFTDPRSTLILAAAGGIARYVAQRYT